MTGFPIYHFSQATLAICLVQLLRISQTSLHVDLVKDILQIKGCELNAIPTWLLNEEYIGELAVHSVQQAGEIFNTAVKQCV